MRTWCRYDGREDRDEAKKLSAAKLALVSEFCKW